MTVVRVPVPPAEPKRRIVLLRNPDAAGVTMVAASILFLAGLLTALAIFSQ